MTPQLRLVAVGTIAAAVAKFGFGKDFKSAAFVGLAAIAGMAILFAHDDK